MDCSSSFTFDVFCSIYDEFEAQSKGRAITPKAVNFYDIALADLSPKVLMFAVQQWMEEFASSPEFYFYRGNFFWRIFVKNDSICAVIVRRGSGGHSPISRTLAWPATSVDPKRVVKNLLDIMKSHERSLIEEKIETKSKRKTKETRSHT